MSRRQTVFTARASERHVRSGTRTATTSAVNGAHRLAPAIARIIARFRSPTAAGLRVADRRARVAHEDVVQRRPRDGDRRDGDAQLGEQPRDERLAVLDVERHRALGHRRPRCRSGPRSAASAASSSAVPSTTRSAPTRGLQRLRRVEDDDLAAVHDRDAVAELRLVHVVRGHEDRRPLGLLQRADVAPDRAARLRVQADRRLVEEQHARRVHAARGRSPGAASCRRRTSCTGWSRRSARSTISSIWSHPGRDDAGVDAVQLGVEPEVLLGGEVAVQRRVLEDQADVAAHVVALGGRRRSR